MAEKKAKALKDVEIIIRYEIKAEENKSKNFQDLMQKLFDLYIKKAVQNSAGRDEDANENSGN